jgi:RNA polymerase sigma factor (sigma-70 family)
MIREKDITKENFETLLFWLDSHRETAAIKYEKIRSRLIRLFAGRGCYEAEELADETINRVTLKVSQIKESYAGEAAHYFYGVANNLHHEWLRKQKKVSFTELKEPGIFDENKECDEEYERFEKSLKQLPDKERELILDYYQKEKHAKIEHRKKIAAKLGLSVAALTTKTCRIRTKLRKAMFELR